MSNNTFLSRQIFCSCCRKTGSAGKTPPSPWIVSNKTAAVSVALMALSHAAMSLSGAEEKPDNKGLKPDWIFSCGVADMPPNVRPWNAFSATTTPIHLPSTPDFFLPWSLASFKSASLASAPLLQNKNLPGPQYLESDSTNLACGSFR